MKNYLERPALTIAIFLFSFCFAQHTNAQLKGTYTIDPGQAASSSNYKNFRSAVTDLDSGKRYDGGTANGKGVSGPVVFKVANGTYNENVHLFTVPGTSASNTVLFESASGDSSKVIISNPGSNVSSVNGNFIDYALFLENVSHVSFNKMTIIRTNPKNLQNGSFEVVLIEGGDSVSIENCKISGPPNPNIPEMPNAVALTIQPATNDAPNNILIHNNLIFRGNPAVSVSGINGGQDNTIMIDGNTVDSSGTNGPGINIEEVKHLIITNNYFGHGFEEISSQRSSDLEITKNIIYGGIFSNQDGTMASPVLIANNEFFGGGFNSISDSLVNVYYNTFYSGGPGWLQDLTSLNFFDNLVYDTISSNITANKTTHSDYNDYIFNPKNYFADYNSSYYTSLQTWQSGTGNDFQSQEISPDFVSNTYLAPKNPALNFGTPIAGITTDINGNPRDPSHPTVGAFNVAHVSDTTLCKSSCAIFSAPVIGTSYRWSTGETTQSVKYCPTSSGPVWVHVQYGPATGDTIRFQFYVTVTNSTCVWPGDANYDGKVDINDMLNIGVAYNDTGAKRLSASNNWFAQSCNDWANSFASGINHKNADCNGDGVVDSSDLPVIALNYSKTHLKTTGVASGNPTDPPLSISFSKDSAMAGDTVQAFINLGSKAIPASNVYGVVLSVNYGTSSPAKYYSADFSNSWLGTYHKNLVSLIVNDSENQEVNIGITRTDHNNASGYGEIAVVSITMPDNLGGKREVKQFVDFNIASYKAISANEANIPLYPTGDSILVYEYKSGIAPNLLNSTDFRIYPNPANDVLHIRTGNSRITLVAVTDIVGKTVYSSGFDGFRNIDLPINTLAKGVYIVNISTSNGNIRTRFIKE